MNTPLRTLLRSLTVTMLFFGVSCNGTETTPQGNEPAAPLPPEAIKLHLAIQGVDPAFVQQLDSAVGFTDIDRVVQHLIQLLHTDSDSKQKTQAAICLGAFYPNSIQPLIQALKSENSDVVMYAAAAFVRIGPNGRQGVPELVEALGHEKWNVRVFAAQALGAMGPDARSEAALKAAVSDSDMSVRKAASDALQRIHGGAS